MSEVLVSKSSQIHFGYLLTIVEVWRIQNETDVTPRYSTYYLTLKARCLTNTGIDYFLLEKQQWWQFRLWVQDAGLLLDATKSVRYPEDSIWIDSDEYTEFWRYSFTLPNDGTIHPYTLQVNAQYTHISQAFTINTNGTIESPKTTDVTTPTVTALSSTLRYIHFVWDALPDYEHYHITLSATHFDGSITVLADDIAPFITNATEYIVASDMFGSDRFKPGDTIWITVRGFKPGTADFSEEASASVQMPGLVDIRVNRENYIIDSTADYVSAIPYIKVNGVWVPAYVYSKNVPTQSWTVVNSLNKGVD